MPSLAPKGKTKKCSFLHRNIGSTPQTLMHSSQRTLPIFDTYTIAKEKQITFTRSNKIAPAAHTPGIARLALLLHSRVYMYLQTWARVTKKCAGIPENKLHQCVSTYLYTQARWWRTIGARDSGRYRYNLRESFDVKYKWGSDTVASRTRR